MSTKAEIRTTLERTEELAKALGLVRQQDRLCLFDAEPSVNVPWSVRLEVDTKSELTRRLSGALFFLPDSGRSIGLTKREAQETLRVVNGVLSVMVAKERMKNHVS